MNPIWQRLISGLSPLQILTLKACAVVGTLGLIILGIDQFIVQPHQGAETAPFDASAVQVKVDPPKLDLGLDEQLRRTRAELDELRLERERQAELRREQRKQASADRDAPR